MPLLKAPFPWFGGKSRVADIIWARLGDVNNYVEPFFGSGAVLLARPHAPKTETINDKDHFVANFWRAVRSDPEAVAHHADWPVTETDLHARHWWLLTEGAARIARIEGDADLYDAEVAGRWVWGLCAWIGSGWCSGKGPWVWSADAGNFVYHSNTEQGINRQLPHLADAGRGINRRTDGTDRHTFILDWMTALAGRLRDVRVAAGDWQRVCNAAARPRLGLTGVFLDPPYSAEVGRTMVYAHDCGSVAHDVRKWAVENGDNPLLRICVAGYEGEHNFPADWEAVRWKATGGYGSQGDGRAVANAERETLWFSPHCLTKNSIEGNIFEWT